ncbi:putative T7SS-secreted protein [Amycolatopsis sp. lyj-109]|uniref:putative T7SS-secreted protein n=1 Tax=Amycolatopsis sp. lyj-109 TaxID=2789287 RepID=UPI003977F5EC
MAELGQTADPKALIPGDPPAVFENARVLSERAKTAHAVGDALRRIDTGAWQGPAADKFHEDHQTEVPRWGQAGDSLDNAALALTDFANCLSWAQGQAAEAIAQWQQGDNATQQAKTEHDRAVADADAKTRANAQHGDPTVVQAPPFTDPGEGQRQAARDILNRARQQLASVGNLTADALRYEGAVAPQDSRKQADANFFGGIWDSIKGAGEGLYQILADPAEVVASMAHNIAHPVDTFKEMVAWDDWANGHGDRALGKITGNMLLGFTAFGAGKLLKERAPGHGEHEPDSERGIPGESGTPDVPTSFAPTDVSKVKEHLSRPGLDHFGPNDVMLDRIGKALAEGKPLSEAQTNFMRHETLEAKLMDGGMGYEEAHAEALQTHPPGKNYDPDVIDQEPLFGPWWRKMNGLGPR